MISENVKKLIPVNTRKEIKEKIKPNEKFEWEKYCVAPCQSFEVIYLKILAQNNICPVCNEELLSYKSKGVEERVKKIEEEYKNAINHAINHPSSLFAGMVEKTDTNLDLERKLFSLKLKKIDLQNYHSTLKDIEFFYRDLQYIVIHHLDYDFLCKEKYSCDNTIPYLLYSQQFKNSRCEKCLSNLVAVHTKCHNLIHKTQIRLLKEKTNTKKIIYLNDFVNKFDRKFLILKDIDLLLKNEIISLDEKNNYIASNKAKEMRLIKNNKLDEKKVLKIILSNIKSNLIKELIDKDIVLKELEEEKHKKRYRYIKLMKETALNTLHILNSLNLKKYNKIAHSRLKKVKTKLTRQFTTTNKYNTRHLPLIINYYAYVVNNFIFKSVNEFLNENKEKLKINIVAISYFDKNYQEIYFLEENMDFKDKISSLFENKRVLKSIPTLSFYFLIEDIEILKFDVFEIKKDEYLFLTNSAFYKL